MDNELTLKGFWWSPDAPKQRWFGVLTQTEKAIELVCYSDAGDIGLVNDESSGTVYGKDEKGRPVTLLVVSRDGSTKSGGMKTVTFSSGYVLLGVHATDRDAIRFKTVDIRLQHLYGWLGITGFNRKSNTQTPDEMTISYNYPPWISHQVREDLKVEFGVNTNSSSKFQTKSITEEASVSLTSETGFSFDQCWEYSVAFRTLLHFASLKPAYSVSMTLHDCVKASDGTKVPSREVRVWSRNFHEPMTLPPIDAYWVFRYNDVCQDFGPFFNRWLTYTEKYNEAFQCYNSTIYHRPPATVEHLSITQALDAYHGVRFNSHGNQTFKCKVKQLLDANKATLSSLIPSDLSAFAERIVITRNYYTHHNPEKLKTGNVAKGIDLMLMNMMLRILFQSCVLSDIGIPVSKLERLRHQMPVKIVEY